MSWKSIKEGASRSVGMQLTNELLSRPEGHAVVAAGTTAAIAVAPVAAAVAAGATLGIGGAWLVDRLCDQFSSPKS